MSTSSTSVDSSSSAMVRIKSVPQHSVTNSIVRNDSPMPAHYLHSSNPTISHKGTANAGSPKRGLGRVPPSSSAPKVGTIWEQPIPDHYSQSSTSDDEEGDVTDGGVDPEKIREQVLSRHPSAPIPIIDPIHSVIYDSSSSSRNSRFQTPDLFPKPLILNEQAQRPPLTPPNSIVTPNPLIGIIPPTPVVTSSPSNSRGSAPSTKDGMVSGYQTSTVVAHTGASTPEESVVQAEDTGVRSPTAEKSTMTNFEYDEDEYENDDGLRTPVEISTPVTPPERQPAPLPGQENSQGGFRSEKAPQSNNVGYYTQEQLDDLSTYSDSDPSSPIRNHIFRTLYEEYISSDPRGSRSKNKRNWSQSQSRRRSASREDGKTSVDQTVLPRSTGTFTRIITDLEDMLNQALELASRAVIDSHTALEQRDASIRSVQLSLRESILDDANSIMGNAESFTTANDEAAEVIDKRYDPSSSQERQGSARDSFAAVYGDDNESTGIPGDNENVNDVGPQRQQRSMIQGKSNENSVEKSRIPRPSRNLTMSSTRSAAFSKGQGRNLQPQREARRRDDRLLTRERAPTYEIRPNDAHNGRSRASLKKKGGWDWSLARKRFSAGVSCAVVFLIGFIIGCYRGEGRTVRQSLGISNSVTSLGNVLFIIGVAVPSLIFWPLSLLHGRKPYFLLSIALTIPLQLPQALSLPPHTVPGLERSMAPFIACILVFRAVSGFVLGFASMNALATLVDLFGPDTGACCRGGVVFNSNVPIEGQDQFHLVPGGEAGTRIGVWLGIWAWLFFAFGGVGFFIGELIVAQSSPAWGFWIVAVIATVVLFLVYLVPEVRPPWKKKRLISRKRTGWKGKEEKQPEDRGEIKMVIFGTSPRWWWEEVWAGTILSFRMLKQLGFLVMTVYVGWVAGEVAMAINVSPFRIVQGMA